MALDKDKIDKIKALGALLRFDENPYVDNGLALDLSNYKNTAITFTSDGYIITHGIAYDATGVAKNIFAPTGNEPANGWVLKYDAENETAIWSEDVDTDTTYKIKLNETYVGGGSTLLAEFYAPTSTSNGFLKYNNGGWVWDDNTYLTSSLIDNKISTALTSAMNYKGTATPSTTTPTEDNVHKGDFYKVSTKGEVFGIQNCKVGDVLIYNGTSWELIPSGDETETILKLVSSDATEITESGELGEIKIGNYAGAISADSKALVTGGAIQSYIASLGYASGTVTGITLNQGTGISITDSGVEITGSGTRTISLNKATVNTIGGIIPFNVLKDSVSLSTSTYNTLNRYYGVQVDKDGKAFVNIPWTNENSSYLTVGDLVLGTNVTLTKDGNTTTISATNTWRPVYAWTIEDLDKADDTIDNILTDSTGTKPLAFSSAFGYREKTLKGSTNKVAEIDLIWAEIDTNGTIKYA